MLKKNLFTVFTMTYGAHREPGRKSRRTKLKQGTMEKMEESNNREKEREKLKYWGYSGIDKRNQKI